MIPAPFDRSKIPHKPGIYIYRSKQGDVIYVGKAIDLFHRVSSYFSGRPTDEKTAHLVGNISSVETVVVESELEALILEANLIKKYLPIYNIRLTDDKDYLYIAITSEDFPKIITARKQDLKKVKRYFGPFPSSRIVKDTLKRLRRIFPWCSGSRSGRGCFYYHLKLCPGACIGLISKQDYNKNTNRFAKFLSGEKTELIDELEGEMTMLSESQQFEEAARTKKIIEGIVYLTQPNRVARYLENPNFLEDERNLALKELQKQLNLKEKPERIEGYDISNIQGQEATGSMVVVTNGEIDKSQYRKFKIHTGKPNDYAMHAEMMRRRLGNNWPLPQLFIIDGGRGQARASLEELKKKGINTPIFGLAKREEWLYPPEGEVIKLPKRSLALRVLQLLRDESHRFAISYHRELRKRKALG